MHRAAITHRAVLLATLLALVVAGCRSTPAEGSADAPQAPDTILEVQNNNWLTVVVYVVRSGMRTRLGSVSSMAEKRFEIPASLIDRAAGVRLEAHPIGTNRRYVAPPVHVGPGQTIDLTVQNHLPISSVTVW